MVNLAVLEFLEILRPNRCVANFSHKHVYSASLHYPMSTRAIDPVRPQAILPMRVTLFPSGIPSVTNIPSINCNDTFLFIIEQETRW